MSDVNRGIDRVTNRIRAAREFSIFIYVGSTIGAFLVSSLAIKAWFEQWSFLMCWSFVAFFFVCWLSFHWLLNRYIVNIAKLFGELDAPVKVQYELNPIVVRQNTKKNGTIIRVDKTVVYDDSGHSNGTVTESDTHEPR